LSQIGERCGFYRTYLSRLERGQANPTLNAMVVIANAFGLTIFEFGEGTEDLVFGMTRFAEIPFRRHAMQVSALRPPRGSTLESRGCAHCYDAPQRPQLS